MQPSYRLDAPLAERFSLGSAITQLGAFQFLLVISIIQFAGSWYWVGVDTSQENIDGGGPFWVQFRYIVWITIFAAACAYLYTRSYKALLQALAPCLPFFLIGVLASFQGLSFILSVRTLIFWMLMALSASVIGLMLPPRRILMCLFWTLFVILGLSLVVSVLFPDWGRHVYGFELVWRGIFQQKNGLGIFAMWAVVIAGLALPTVGVLRAALLFTVAAICLIMSGSMGSLVVAFAGIAYFFLLRILLRMGLSAGVGASLMIASVALMIVVVLLAWIPVTTALGRDPTLTGRTVIWATYLNEVPGHWILGQGPGAFSGGSSISQRLFLLLQSLGSIRQPHNGYIMALGEGGLLGLAAYVGMLFYIAFVAPFRMRTPESIASAIGAFLVMVGGLAEGRGVYNASFEGFMMLLFRALAARSVMPNYPYGRRTV